MVGVFGGINNDSCGCVEAVRIVASSGYDDGGVLVALRMIVAVVWR